MRIDRGVEAHQFVGDSVKWYDNSSTPSLEGLHHLLGNCLRIDFRVESGSSKLSSQRIVGLIFNNNSDNLFGDVKYLNVSGRHCSG
jgi:hypothetical protein